MDSLIVADTKSFEKVSRMLIGFRMDFPGRYCMKSFSPQDPFCHGRWNEALYAVHAMEVLCISKIIFLIASIHFLD
jgi:hypothetical protein